jgi:hypothetical protein
MTITRSRLRLYMDRGCGVGVSDGVRSGGIRSGRSGGIRYGGSGGVGQVEREGRVGSIDTL